MGKRKSDYCKYYSLTRKRNKRSKVACLRWEKIKQNNVRVDDGCSIQHGNSTELTQQTLTTAMTAPSFIVSEPDCSIHGDSTELTQQALTTAMTAPSFIVSEADCSIQHGDSTELTEQALATAMTAPYVSEPGPSGLQRLVSPKNSSSEESIGSFKICPNLEKNVENNEHTPPSNISFISEEEYNKVMAHDLYYECDDKNQPYVVSGNRIVNLQYVLSWSIDLQYKHSKICTCGKIFLKEKNRLGLGLISRLKFGCTMCDKEYTYHTEDVTKKSKINYGFVWGTLATSSTFGHSQELFSVIDIPPMTLYNFKKIESELGDVWKDTLFKEMEDNGKEELKLAIEQKEIDNDGVPYIAVYLDGGWSKRSYGHSYDAASGVSLLTGEQKLLFLGVRNKYCSICARAANKKTPPNEHICYRNWASSSSAMEADIMVEGFRTSIQMHGVRYKKFIADGDSSVYAKIRQNVDYGSSVQKIECVNHVIKNYGKKLRHVKSDVGVNIAARKLLTFKNIMELENALQNVIYTNADNDTEALKNYIKITPNHVFGDHEKCGQSYCIDVGSKAGNEFNALKSTGLLLHLNSALDAVIQKAHKLIDPETNNRAELFMSILARFNAGKRLNLTQRGSFQNRSYLAGLRYDKGVNWHSTPWKNVMSESSGQHFKMYMESQKNKRDSNSAQTSKTLKKRKSTKLPDKDYGQKAEQPELTNEEMESERSRKLKEMQVTVEEQIEIQSKTIGQFNNEIYILYKKDRLTASHFGAVVKRQDHTSCHSLVKSILYGGDFQTMATEYGKLKVGVVKDMYSKENNKLVRECGIFIDLERGYLAATPDSLVNSNTVIEIKCLYKVAKQCISLRNAIETDKALCLTILNNEIKLKTNHSYYYQVQGQLNICNKDVCYFIVYSGDKNPIHVEKIYKNEEIWQKKNVTETRKFLLALYFARDHFKKCYSW